MVQSNSHTQLTKLQFLLNQNPHPVIVWLSGYTISCKKNQPTKGYKVSNCLQHPFIYIYFTLEITGVAIISSTFLARNSAYYTIYFGERITNDPAKA